MRHFFLSFAVLFGPTLAMACSCNYPSEWTADRVLEEYCRADAVFVGDVESSLEIRRFLVEYKIWPRKSFRGRLKSPSFGISELGGRCGYSFEPGAAYLIFAEKNSKTNFLNASACGLTGMVHHRQSILEIIEEASKAEEDVCSETAVAERKRQASDRAIEVHRELLEKSRDLQNHD